jgi:hypothetical protein
VQAPELLESLKRLHAKENKGAASPLLEAMIPNFSNESLALMLEDIGR